MDDAVRTSGHYHLEIQVLHHQHHMPKMVLETMLDVNTYPSMFLEEGTRRLVCLFLVLVQAEVISCWVAHIMETMI